MKLAEICEVYSGYALKEFNNALTGRPVIKIGNILYDGSLSLKECQYTTESVNEKYLSKKGDIFIALSGATTGKIGIMHTHTQYVINQRVGIVRRKDIAVPEKYIKYFLIKNTEKILQDAAGCAQPNVSPKQIAQYELPNHNKADMNRISETLDVISDIIAKRKQELQTLDDLVKARFVEMFGDPNDTKVQSNNRHKIGELCDVTKLAGFEFTEYINYQDSGEIIMLRGLNCKKGKLVLDNVKYIDKETSLKLPRSRLYYGDILMTYAGTIGDVAMVDEDDKYHLAPNVAKISIVEKEKVNPIFLIHLFMYSHDYIMTFASQVAQASINMQKIRDFEYIIPCMEEQNKFADFVQEVDKSKFVVQKALINTLVLDSLIYGHNQGEYKNDKW